MCCTRLKIVKRQCKDLDTRLGGDQQDGFVAELNTFGRDGVILGPVVGAIGEMSSHVDLLADVIADALTAEHLSYKGDRGSKTAKAYKTAGCFIARGDSSPIVDGRALCSIVGASYKPRTPHGTKANTPVLVTTTTKRPLTKVI